MLDPNQGVAGGKAAGRWQNGMLRLGQLLSLSLLNYTLTRRHTESL